MKKRRDLRMKGTHKHTEASLKHCDNHRCLFRSEESKCMWTHTGTVFTMCSHTFTHFWSRKRPVIVERFHLSFYVFVCAFLLDISSFFSVRDSSFFSYFCVIIIIVSYFLWPIFYLLSQCLACLSRVIS